MIQRPFPSWRGATLAALLLAGGCFVYNQSLFIDPATDASIDAHQNGGADASLSVTALAVTPAAAVVNIDQGITLQATATMSDGSHRDVGNVSTWSSSSVPTASVSQLGQVTGLQSGSVTITAQYLQFSSSTALTVSSSTVVSLTIAPANLVLSPASTTQFTAQATYADQSVSIVTQNPSVSWISTNTGVVTCQPMGAATMVDAGSSTVTASLNGVTSNVATITVKSSASPPALTGISIAPSPVTLVTYQSTQQQLTATGTYSDGTTPVLTASAAWAAQDTSIASVSNQSGSQGLVTVGGTVGSTVVTATYGGFTSSVTVYVKAGTPPLAQGPVTQ